VVGGDAHVLEVALKAGGDHQAFALFDPAVVPDHGVAEFGQDVPDVFGPVGGRGRGRVGVTPVGLQGVGAWWARRSSRTS